MINQILRKIGKLVQRFYLGKQRRGCDCPKEGGDCEFLNKDDDSCLYGQI